MFFVYLSRFGVVVVDLLLAMIAGLLGGWALTTEYWKVILPKEKREIFWKGEKKKGMRKLFYFKKRVEVSKTENLVLKLGMPSKAYGLMGGAGIALAFQKFYELIIEIFTPRLFCNNMSLSLWGILLFFSVMLGGICGNVGYRFAVRKRTAYFE